MLGIGTEDMPRTLHGIAYVIARHPYAVGAIITILPVRISRFKEVCNLPKVANSCGTAVI